MTNKLTKEMLTEKIGKNSFLSIENLAAKLNYESGIQEFDEYLNGKTLKQINAVIHLTKHPKGLAIMIVKNFSTFPYELPFSDIKRIIISEINKPSLLIFETSEKNKIIFSIKPSSTSDVKTFLNDIHLKYDNDNNDYKNIKDEIMKKEIVEIDTNPVSAYISIVSSLLIIIGCFMPWMQLGTLFQKRGIDNPDGAIMLVTAVIAGAIAVFNLTKKENKNTWLFIVVGLIGCTIFYYNITEINSKANTINEGVEKLSNLYDSNNNVSTLNFIGSGLYILLLSSIGLILSGFGLFSQITIENQNETTKN